MLCIRYLEMPFFKPIGSIHLAYIWLNFMVNVGKYTSPMDPIVGKMQCKYQY